MNFYRIALANLRFPSDAAHSVALASSALREAAAQGARIVCFPECYVPGYRAAESPLPPPDQRTLEHAWRSIADAAAHAQIAVILATERLEGRASIATALVINPDGSFAGWQDKVQIDPSEEGTYTPGAARHVFHVAGLTFGIAICHEGWRYPETVRWPVRQGARVVFHPHFHAAEPGSFRPTQFSDPANSFHEKAMLCRAAENTCFFASVNYASAGSPTTSAVVRPDGTLLCHQPYGVEGLLMADLDLDAATGLLARRLRPCE
jgi:predicted amidohydrolase